MGRGAAQAARSETVERKRARAQNHQPHHGGFRNRQDADIERTIVFEGDVARCPLTGRTFLCVIILKALISYEPSYSRRALSRFRAEPIGSAGLQQRLCYGINGKHTAARRGSLRV